MIILSMSICFRCQKGGEPASRVYMITPVLHLWVRPPSPCSPEGWRSRGTPLPLPHSHVHLLPVARVVIVHGALDDLWGQVTGGPTDLCKKLLSGPRSELDVRLGPRWVSHELLGPPLTILAWTLPRLSAERGLGWSR